MQTLRRIFITNTSNSIAVTGPFGSGKSSLLVYLEALLKKGDEFQLCIDKLEQKDQEVFLGYQELVGKNKKGFFSLKIVGEHLSFKSLFITALLENSELKDTHKFIKNNQETSFTRLLKQLDAEVKKLGYSGLLILIDELGKIIEYASEKYISSDIHALQDLAEYINKQKNSRLVVALHKSFKDYVQNTTHLSFTEWDKIQGRFDNIIFQDDFYELMHIFEEAISCKSQKSMQQVTSKIDKIFTTYMKHVPHKHIPVESQSLEKLAPLHPFSSLALFHIFSKHFQNQRSIFSFLAAQEPYSFQSFITQEVKEADLYTLDMLFDYINYLINAYTVNMVDKESWKLANEYLDSANRLTPIQTKIIKAIALISSFGLEDLIQLDEVVLGFSFNENTVEKEIKELKEKGYILYKRVTNSFALIEETSINIDDELTHIIKNQIAINYQEEINKIIEQDRILAKRFHIETGTAKFFEKEYIDNNLLQSKNIKYKLIYVNSEVQSSDVVEISKKNERSIYIPLSFSNEVKNLISLSLAIEVLLKKKEVLSNQRVYKILLGLLNTNTNEINKILDIKEQLFYAGEAIQYSSEKLQQTISHILQTSYPDMPIIINDLINPVQHETSVPNGMKKLFEHMIEHEKDEKLAIEKQPPQLAIYLSVIKKSGLHSFKSGKWSFTNPKNDNFMPIWNKILRSMKSQKSIIIDDMIHKLTIEPFGLNRDAAKFVLFTFLIMYEKNIHFFRENTYKFDFDIDEIMDVWKNTKLYTIRWYELSKDEEVIFTKYIQIFDKYFETQYSKKSIKYVFEKLFTKLNKLPLYCHQTKELSNKAIDLRSAISSSKEPHSIFFEVFPKALGYDELNVDNIDTFIEEFKDAFNEIVFSYKKMVLNIEEILADAFDLKHKNYPYGKELETVFEKYLEEQEDKDVTDIYRVCSTANDLVTFLNGLALVLIGKKVDDAFDHDIKELERNIYTFANKVLSKLDIVELINKRPVDVKKLKITTIDGDSNLIATVEKSKLDELSGMAEDILYNLKSQTLTKDEKLYLITLLAEEAIKGK